MNKHIAFIGVKGLPADFNGSGGIEYGVERTVEELVKMGFRVTVFVRYWATPQIIRSYHGIKIIHLPSITTKYTDTLTHCFLASIYVCFKDYDVICYRAVGSAFFSFLPKIFGKKIITTIHGADWKRDKWGTFGKYFLKLCEQIAIHISNKIVVVSSELLNMYKKRNIKTNLISNAFERKNKIGAKIISHKYGLKGNDYILYLGRFVQEKRLEWLIRAYQKLNLRSKLVLVGGSSNTDSYVINLKQIAAGNKNIIFTNYIFGREKAELLSNCRLFVQPSKLEGCSNALIDAIQYHQAILAADIPSNKELINNNYFLFRNSSFNDFCRKLNQLLSSKKIVYTPKEAVWQYTWQKVAKLYSELF